MRVRARSTAVTATLLVAVASSAAVAQYNVARDRPWQCDCDVMDGWGGLVDGIADSDTGPACFATSNEPDFPKSVTIDLERPCLINRIAVHNSTNGNTRGIILSCSQDDEEFEKLREFIFPRAQPITLNHRFNDRTAQFVRVSFANTWGGGLGGDNRIYVREVEVFGMPTGDAPVMVAPPEPTGDPVASTRAVRLFRRWAVKDDAALTLAVLGDSLADCGAEQWPQIVAERLQYARPDEAPVSVAAMTERGLKPDATSGHIDMVAEAQPDLILVTFGTDLTEWDREAFASGLSNLVNRLLSETEALVVLVGPLPGESDDADVARCALREMDRLAQALGLPLVRTEVALSDERLTGETVRGDDGMPSEEARGAIANTVLELLLEP